MRSRRARQAEQTHQKTSTDSSVRENSPALKFGFKSPSYPNLLSVSCKPVNLAALYSASGTRWAKTVGTSSENGARTSVSSERGFQDLVSNSYVQAIPFQSYESRMTSLYR